MIVKKINSIKKAQVGLTISWFFAFLIIFFLLIIFTVYAIYLSGQKTFTAKNEIDNVGGISSDTNLQIKLYSLLDSNVEFEGNLVRIEDLVIFLNKGSNEKKLNKIKLSSEEDICFDYILETPKVYLNWYNSFFEFHFEELDRVHINDDFGLSYDLGEPFVYYIFNEGEKIEFKFYQRRIC